MMSSALFLALMLLIGGVATSSINCKRSTNCSCMMNSRRRVDVEFTCNTYDEKTTSVRINGARMMAEIQCGYHEPPTFPPDVHVGDVNTAMVSFCIFSQNLTEVSL